MDWSKGYNKSGKNIAKGCVIGAGTLLTKDTHPYEIWGGVPGRLLKKRQ